MGFPRRVFSGVFIQIEVEEDQRRTDINQNGQRRVVELQRNWYEEFHCILRLSHRSVSNDDRRAYGRGASAIPEITRDDQTDQIHRAAATDSCNLSLLAGSRLFADVAKLITSPLFSWPCPSA